MSRPTAEIGPQGRDLTPTATPLHRWRIRALVLIGAVIIAGVGLVAIFWPQPDNASATPPGKGYECLLLGGIRLFWTWSSHGDTVLGHVDYRQFGGPVTGTQSGSSLLLYESVFPFAHHRMSFTATVEGDLLNMRVQGAHGTFDCRLESDAAWYAYVRTLPIEQPHQPYVLPGLPPQPSN